MVAFSKIMTGLVVTAEAVQMDQGSSSAETTPIPGGQIDYHSFYNEWHGHKIEHLEKLHKYLREYHAKDGQKKPFIWLIGDSSLDNKYWVGGHNPNRCGYLASHNGYENIISKPVAIADIAYWMNYKIVDKGLPYCCINGSIEATRLGQRDFFGWNHSDYWLLAQDKFVRDNMQDDDILICSVAGNDIALLPTPATIIALLRILKIATDEQIESGNAPGMGRLVDIFKDKVKYYLDRIIANTKVSKVLVCMIYYPSVVGTGWADSALKKLGYTDRPERLQNIIRVGFKIATSEIKLKNVDDKDVIPVPLFKVLDPTNTHDYENRVEPSRLGGSKMADAFLNALANPEEAKAQGLDWDGWSETKTEGVADDVVPESSSGKEELKHQSKPF